MSATETIAFQAETRQLLDLVIHSLYTHKEIFLRELLSNASDALDRLRQEALREDGAEVPDPESLRIRLEVDAEKRILEVDDNGVGMSRDEVIANLGTIANSGTRGFLEELRAKKEEGAEALAQLPDLIGQFGVGFYSAFMVADLVEVETRRRGEERGVRWTSRGDGEYTLEEIDRAEPGTTIVLHLKAPEGEGDRDFTQPHVLREVVKKYSDFIEYPIRLVTEADEDGEESVETLNSRRPLWTRPASEVEDDEYKEFYRHLTHDWNEPLERIHFRAEGTSEYTALLYLPRERMPDLFDPSRAKSRVHLYVKRVFIMEDCEELLPVWLRFVRGVVDSSDLPLNVSRETLQHNRQMGRIQKRLTTKVLETLARLLRDRREDYAAFWNNFGLVLKEGIYYEPDRAEELAKLALFDTTHVPEASTDEETDGKDARDARTTLAEYVERMPVKQKAIYVLLADDLDHARRSPHLEALRKRGFEVLLLTDPVDEFWIERLPKFADHELKRVDRGEVDLDDEDAKEEREEQRKELEPVLEAIRKELAEHVEDVRLTGRLEESAACLVDAENALPPQLRRMLRDQGQAVPDEKRILELNPSHPLVQRLAELAADDADYARFSEACELLLGTACVAEGGSPPDPARYAALVSKLVTG